MQTCIQASLRGALIAVGLNHHTAPVAVRERLALDLAGWRSSAPDLSHVLLATCNRTEVYAWDTGRGDAASRELSRALAHAAGLPRQALAPHLFVRRRLDAIVHVVRVATGLDSAVVGEQQILGQLRSALRLARDSGDAAAALDGVLARALEAGRRVRASTLLGRQPSLAAAAVDVALRTPELAATGLAGRQAVVLGAGVMGRSAAQALVAAGANVILLNRTFEHARQLAFDLGPAVRAAAIETLPELLGSACLVIAATGCRRPVLDAATVEAALAGRGAEPLVLLDVALPRNIEPAVRAISRLRLIDLDDLEHLCPIDRALRQAEIERAEALALDEAQAIGRWLRIRAMSPTIAGLRQQGHAIRSLELRRAGPRLAGLTPAQYSAVDHLTEAIVNKLLHGPTVALREAAAGPGGSGSGRRVLDVLGFERGRHAAQAQVVLWPR